MAVRKQLKNGHLVELVPGKDVKVSLHWQASTRSSEILRKLGTLVLEEATPLLSPDKYRMA
jgi:LysR family transcriptional regulator (chromosome initiation inhibitor)